MRNVWVRRLAIASLADLVYAFPAKRTNPPNVVVWLVISRAIDGFIRSSTNILPMLESKKLSIDRSVRTCEANKAQSRLRSAPFAFRTSCIFRSPCGNFVELVEIAQLKEPSVRNPNRAIGFSAGIMWLSVVDEYTRNAVV